MQSGDNKQIRWSLAEFHLVAMKNNIPNPIARDLFHPDGTKQGQSCWPKKLMVYFPLWWNLARFDPKDMLNGLLQRLTIEQFPCKWYST